MTPDLATILAGIICAVGSIVAAVLAVRIGFQKLEDQQIRRLQVQCVVRLYGLRHALSANANAELVLEFLSEINKIGALFSAHASVQIHLRNYRNNRSNPNFISLIREAAEKAGMNTSGLSNDDIETIFQFQ